jgi:hypothetical protein
MWSGGAGDCERPLLKPRNQQTATHETGRLADCEPDSQPPQLSSLQAFTWQRQHRGSALVDLDGGVDLADEQEAAEKAGEAAEHEDAVAHDEHVAEVDGRC